MIAAFERIAEAYDFMAGSLEAIAITLDATHQKTFPPRRPPDEATITRIPTMEEQLRIDQGQSNQSLKDWTQLDEEAEIGPRERQWLKDKEREGKKV